ncbi:MAG: NAD-dependent epimerase/dehydratase family protein [Chloroflexi bacterium]|nr:NAD-dependent epimerase/dehydratase family protein [Chloroflexota bacterium]
MNSSEKILVTGGAGYVGSALCPKLLKQGYNVRVLDLFIYDPASLDACKKYNSFETVKGDIRNKDAVQQAMKDMDCVIHLASISNDPTGDLDESLTRSVNFEAYKVLLDSAKRKGVKRFINASSSSVYGIKDEENVTEELSCNPLTYYSKYKLMSEKLVEEACDDKFTTVNIRPATICGYSPRQRLDLTVNVLTAHAASKGVITVHGGQQRRPNLTMEDITDLYVKLVETDKSLIAGKVFNVGYENMKIIEIAELVKQTLGSKRDVQIRVDETFDHRDYHISSEKIRKELGFQPKATVKDMILQVASAMEKGLVGNIEWDKYYNIRQMKLDHFA